MSRQLKRREPVNWFSREMEKRLRANDHKTGWDGLDPWWLYRRIEDERTEIARALAVDRAPGKLRAEAIIRECADVANFAMMIADNARQEMERHPQEESEVEDE